MSGFSEPQGMLQALPLKHPGDPLSKRSFRALRRRISHFPAASAAEGCLTPALSEDGMMLCCRQNTTMAFRKGVYSAGAGG